MAYVSDSNLTQFWGLAKDYIKAENSRYANWQQTEKAGAVTCWPVGGTPLLPTVDFLFSETGPASGDKGPENPSTITGVSSVKVTRCGKNLLPFPYYSSSTSYGNASFTVNSDGTITVNGENNTGSTVVFRIASYASVNVLLKSGITYKLTGCPQGGGNNTYKLYMSANTAGAFSATSDVGNGTTVTPTKDTLVTLYIEMKSGVIVNNVIFTPQIEISAEATAFESPTPTSYTLPLGNTYYGGEIDLATGLMTVTQFQIALTGDETFSASDKGDGWLMFFYKPSGIIPLDGAVSSDKACTHFPFVFSSSQQLLHWYVQSAGNICIFSNEFADADAFKSWLAAQALAGTPVQVTYKIATPYTVQLDPVSLSALAQTSRHEPRLNTVYTDASAVQVGYAKSPIRSEYELTQAIIATEGGE